MTGGQQFEAEIREQPAVLAAIAAAPAAPQLDDAIGKRDVLFIGSGSSLFVAQLAALAWRRSGRPADAVAATEARFQAAALQGRCVVALSQSGRTADVLNGLAALQAARTIALTNDPASQLAARAGVTIDVHAGVERAVPASKSVTSMAALLLWAAWRPSDGDELLRAELGAASHKLGAWLDGEGPASMEHAAAAFAPCASVVITGAGYGVPVADEIALKIKEASYYHAEGFGAGEFRHGSTAVLDAARGLIGIIDGNEPEPAVAAVLDLGRETQATIASFGAAHGDVPAYGPRISGRFAPLGWIVAGQLFALALARRRGVDSDTPRGLRKFLA